MTFPPAPIILTVILATCFGRNRSFPGNSPNPSTAPVRNNFWIPAPRRLTFLVPIPRLGTTVSIRPIRLPRPARHPPQKVYWIAAYAQVAPVVGAPTPQYGWKTTSIVQNDISVHTPWTGGLPGTNTTWLTNYYQPPAGGPAAPLDLAFKLETPTNIPTFCEDSNDAVKYVQLPNLQGLDVWDSGPTVLADDFVCTATGPITDIHIWGSWLNDDVATNSTTFTLAIYDERAGLRQHSLQPSR